MLLLRAKDNPKRLCKVVVCRRPRGSVAEPSGGSTSETAKIRTLRPQSAEAASESGLPGDVANGPQTP